MKGECHMSRNAGTDKPKKPIYKKWWFWVIVVIVLAAIFGNKGGKDADAEQAAAPAAETSTASASEATDGGDALDLDVTFYDEFRNDVTGRWRKALVATSQPIEEYALDYYKEYFKADDEVHVIYNFTLNTVNCLTVSGDTLFISVSEYVDGEEHDAKEACGGLHLSDASISISTGEVL